jgi:outer membrane receptor protein involved in Fe transport
MRPLPTALMLVLLMTGGARAQSPGAPAPATVDPQTAAQQKPDEPYVHTETVVVTPSRTEERLVDAPATMSVITAEQIELAPARNFAELLRSVPGLNLTQVSARDMNLTTRGATGTLATGQLALLDGRSLYQDFFGFVMWDFLPVNLDEIKQVEVIRGPASAMWGANALNGVVNVITKTPREMQGSSAIVGLGGFARSSDGDGSRGGIFYISGTHAQAVDDRWAFKLSGGGYGQDALPRPTGIIPGSPNTPYPPYVNTGTWQPRLDGRLDYDFEDGRRLAFSSGVAGTEGIMHSGIGPFDIGGGSTMAYARVNFTRGGFRAAFFTNRLDGNASNLLTRDVNLRPITFDFKTSTYDLEVGDARPLAGRHVLSYGGNFRHNEFDLSLAPQGDNRTEFGIYGQDEIFLTDRTRLVAGARLDRFDFLDHFVFSPRVAFLVKPAEHQTVRLSYNRAYRSPSVVNNFLDVTLAEPINLGAFSPALAGMTYLLPIRSMGNPDLDEQVLDAYEVGFSAIVARRATVSAAAYINRTKNDILFTELTGQQYTAANPPPGWPLPPAVIALVPGGSFPASFTYLNFGRVTQPGLELGIDGALSREVTMFANYSWQGEPRPQGFDLSELNLPPTNRFNIGIGVNRARVLGNLSLNYSSGAFWQDVLDVRYHGSTESHTIVNGGVGVRWLEDRVTTSIKAINLANQRVQQHVFGDILRRQVIGEMRIKFGAR